MIWGFAGDPENQVIEYHWYQLPGDFLYMQVTYDGGLTYHGDGERVDSATRHLGTLGACRDSRAVTIRQFPDHLDWKEEADNFAMAVILRAVSRRG